MKIVVSGIGYVGLSNAILLAQHNEVVAVDIDKNKLLSVNARRSPFEDQEIKEFLENNVLNLYATDDWHKAYKDAEFVIVFTPTNYDVKKDFFDTSSVETVIANILLVCQKTIWLNEGNIELFDETKIVTKNYLAYCETFSQKKYNK